MTEAGTEQQRRSLEIVEATISSANICIVSGAGVIVELVVETHGLPTVRDYVVTRVWSPWERFEDEGVATVYRLLRVAGVRDFGSVVGRRVRAALLDKQIVVDVLHETNDELKLFP